MSRYHRSRRCYQRARGRQDYLVLREQYRQDRRVLKKAIKASKNRYWRELCDGVNGDPWGKVYKAVMAKLKGSPMPVPICPDLLHEIVTTFPTTTGVDFRRCSAGAY